MAETATTVWTIGHSTRGIAECIGLLADNSIEVVADVRSIPYSRRNPHYNREILAEKLGEAGMAYIHVPGLGGFRKALPGSPNTGLVNASFRGYADYMLTPEFDGHLMKLIDTAKRTRTAIMCAEAVPWRCHRSLIADALMARGVAVLHIMDAGACRPHRSTPGAQVRDGHVTYPPVVQDSGG
jgi:uncharacterized protein (DUF488 family)